MLTSCPECNGEVSDQAPTCPHCGYLLHSSTPHGKGPSSGSLRVREKGKPVAPLGGARSRGGRGFRSESKGIPWWVWPALGVVVLAFWGVFYHVIDRERRLEKMDEQFQDEKRVYDLLLRNNAYRRAGEIVTCEFCNGRGINMVDVPGKDEKQSAICRTCKGKGKY